MCKSKGNRHLGEQFVFSGTKSAIMWQSKFNASMLFKTGLSLIFVGLLNHSISVSLTQAAPTTASPTAKPSNVPPEAVMNKFYGYLQQYRLWLGDDRGACSYEIDPVGVKKDGTDRFFLAKISRGRVGTGCRGVLAFQIMQVDCKTETLYQFAREQKDDIRVAGWERYEVTLNDPNARSSGTLKNQSAEAVKAICAL